MSEFTIMKEHDTVRLIDVFFFFLDSNKAVRRGGNISCSASGLLTQTIIISARRKPGGDHWSCCECVRACVFVRYLCKNQFEL